MYWEFIFKKLELTQVLIDSSAAEATSKRDQDSARCKNTDIWFHHAKVYVREKVLILSHVFSTSNTTDLLTKTMELSPFTRIVKLIGLSDD